MSESHHLSADALALLHERYRSEELPENLTETPVLLQQLAHRSVRKFQEREVSESSLLTMIAAAQSASTSSNLQSWSVVAVREQDTKDRLAVLANNQAFVAKAPLFLVWLADHSRAVVAAEQSETPLNTLNYLETTILGFVDAALAAQNASLAAESLGLGITFIGSIRDNPDQVAELLGLPDHVFPVFGMVVGYPDPAEEAGIKPRASHEMVLHRERYDSSRTAEFTEKYNQSLANYYAQYGRTPTWSRTVVSRLATVERLNGRDQLAQHLRDKKFGTD